MTRPAGLAYGALALADTLIAAGPPSRARLLTKPLLMPVLSSVSSGHRGLRTAQAFSWGGDVALMREGPTPFLTGLSSFLAAHVAYIASYRARSSSSVLGTPGRRRLLAATTASAVGMALAARRHDPELLVPVAVYGTTLGAMVAAAAAIDPDRGRARVLTGAVLFLASDTLIGLRAFVLDGADAPLLEATVMATYTGAQWCIADGLAPSRG